MRSTWDNSRKRHNYSYWFKSQGMKSAPAQVWKTTCFCQRGPVHQPSFVGRTPPSPGKPNHGGYVNDQGPLTSWGLKARACPLMQAVETRFLEAGKGPLDRGVGGPTTWMVSLLAFLSNQPKRASPQTKHTDCWITPGRNGGTSCRRRKQPNRAESASNRIQSQNPQKLRVRTPLKGKPNFLATRCISRS